MHTWHVELRARCTAMAPRVEVHAGLNLFIGSECTLKQLWAQAYGNRPKVKTWAKVAGPATAVRKTANGIGWRTLGPFRWRNEEGIDLFLDRVSTCTLVHLSSLVSWRYLPCTFIHVL